MRVLLATLVAISAMTAPAYANRGPITMAPIPVQQAKTCWSETYWCLHPVTGKRILCARRVCR